MASRSVNKWIGIGHLGRDAEVRQAGGVSVVNFSVACTRRWKDSKTGDLKEDTDGVPHKVTP